jgi:chorismate dehydratase
MKTMQTVPNLSLHPKGMPASQEVEAASKSEVLARIGAVSYLNTKPLIYELRDVLGGGGQLSLDLPSRLADQLASQQIDIGLIPVIEYFPHPEYRIVSNAAIACDGPVWSVRIFFRCPPHEVKTLALDEGSRTSAGLSKVLFHSRFGFVPQTIPLSMDENPMESRADAVLVIGDRAMHPQRFRPQFQLDWDLGQVWKEETGLPFVFALWIARNESFATGNTIRLLESARDRGIRHIQEIAAKAAPEYGLTPEQCSDYLTNYIRFQLGDDARAGLEEFRRRCQELGLATQQPNL